MCIIFLLCPKSVHWLGVSEMSYHVVKDWALPMVTHHVLMQVLQKTYKHLHGLDESLM